MSNLFHRLASFVMQLGIAVFGICLKGAKVVVTPLVGLAKALASKGNRVVARLVFKANRFFHIARNYGYKRAMAHLVSDFEKTAVAAWPTVKTGAIRLAPMCLVAVVLAVAIQGWTTFTMAYEVTYDGNNIGYVASEAVMDEACKMVGDRVVNEEFSAKEVTYTLKVVSANAVNNAGELCDNIIEVSDDIQPAVGLYVDGNLVVACKDGEQIKQTVKQVAQSYARSNGKETISFANEIEYISGVFPVEQIQDSVSEQELAAQLTVMQTVQQTYTRSVPYQTVEVKSDKHYVGYRFTKTAGRKGTEQVVANVSYVDGKEVNRTVVSTTQTQKPITEVILVGTKKFGNISGKETGAPMFWPVAGTDVSNISSYFGEMRSTGMHQGTDICAPNGTPIFAAEAGTVVEVGWGSGYGNYVIINHGNGVSTLYSHCSSISAIQGQKVNRGDYIAAVGITGRASAYHCHFEVRIQGTPVDGCPYIGVNR